MQFTEKLNRLAIRFDELNGQMADPAVIADAELYRKVSKEHSGLSDVVGKYREWLKVEEELSQARPMLKDADAGMREMAQEEIARLVGWVHMFSALMSAGICQEVGCAPNTDGTATVTMECADTPATWPADMAADFLPLRSVQYLNRMEAWSKHVGVWDPTAAAA